jgi:hypothetical protein
VEIDDRVRVAKKCPYCGAANPERRTQLRDIVAGNVNGFLFILPLKRSGEYNPTLRRSYIFFRATHT